MIENGRYVELYFPKLTSVDLPRSMMSYSIELFCSKMNSGSLRLLRSLVRLSPVPFREMPYTEFASRTPLFTFGKPVRTQQSIIFVRYELTIPWDNSGLRERSG